MTDGSDRLVRRASVAVSATLIVTLAATLAYISWPRPRRIWREARGRARGVCRGRPRRRAREPVRPRRTPIARARSCSACERAQPFLKMSFRT
jgi:hypothetical protein